MMAFIPWQVSMKASSHRSCELKGFTFDRTALAISLIEEETEEEWTLKFSSFQAFRLITEECSSGVIENLPIHGGFFKSSNSEWLKRLGKGDIAFLHDACHFVICCYDEVIEVVANESCPQLRKN